MSKRRKVLKQLMKECVDDTKFYMDGQNNTFHIIANAIIASALFKERCKARNIGKQKMEGN